MIVCEQIEVNGIDAQGRFANRPYLFCLSHKVLKTRHS